MREWIDWAAGRFAQADLHYGHGTTNSRDEAYWLVLHAINVPVQGLFGDWDQVPDPSLVSKIKAIVDKRIDQRCPAAYLTGTAWFAGLEFEVSPDVLVPRSPLAELITQEFSPWLNPEDVLTVLDLCTGSGCIAIACATHFPEARVFASDISEPALQIANRNIHKHAMDQRVVTIHSDLFDSVGDHKYDLIISNPPYVPERILNKLPQEYRAEPELGLVSGLGGLEIPIRILEHAVGHLNPGGVLVCEVGESHERLQEALPQVAFTWLEFESGGEGVFLLDQEQLGAAAEAAGKYLRNQ